MPTVRDVICQKGSKVYSIEASANVLEATRKMNQHKIGALVVMNAGNIVGMFTERDVLSRVVAAQQSPRDLLVADAMTADVICITPDEDLDDVSRIMKDRKIRHIPVIDDGGDLIGLVSMGDVNAWHASNQEQTIHFLHDYIYGRV